jgi:hypothetical protein
MTENKTNCASLFAEYVAVTEDIKRRAHEMPDQINVLAARNKELVEEHDAAFLLGDQKRVDEIIAKCGENDSRIKWLQHQQELLLGKRGTRDNPKLKELAAAWETEASQEVAVLDDEWQVAENALEQAQTAMLACVAKLGAIAKKANRIRHQSNMIAQGGHKIRFISLPNDSTDHKRPRGLPWAVNADLITKTYKDGKMEE